MRKLCGIFVPIVSRRSAENSAWIKLIVPSAEARFDTWRHRRRKEKKSRQRRINVQSAFRVLSTGALSNGPEHAHLGVCFVRDGVQMILPVGSHNSCLFACTTQVYNSRETWKSNQLF